MKVKDLIAALKKMPKNNKVAFNDEILGRYYDSEDLTFEVFEIDDDEVVIAAYRPEDYE